MTKNPMFNLFASYNPSPTQEAQWEVYELEAKWIYAYVDVSEMECERIRKELEVKIKSIYDRFEGIRISVPSIKEKINKN